ncbi:MAG: hypothetical protein R3C19_11985 [Planctomycetaceae bacterium]
MPQSSRRTAFSGRQSASCLNGTAIWKAILQKHGGPTAVVTKNIEDIQPGQRVVGRNPLREQTQAAAEINPQTSRAVRLSMTQHGVHYDLTLLRPLAWLEATGLRSDVPFTWNCTKWNWMVPPWSWPLIHVRKSKRTTAHGRNIVTGTMKHPAANILDISITGLEEPLGVIDTHPF